MSTAEKPDSPSSVILYPCPGMGHLRPMIELAKLLRCRNPRLPITVLVVPPNYHHGSFAPYLAHAIAANPSLSFHHLPAVPPPSPAPSSPHRSSLVFHLLRRSNPNLLSFLQTAGPVSALIADFFATCSVDVTSKLNIPTYVFFPSPASFLALFLHFPALHSRFSHTTFRRMGPALVTDVPGLPDLPAHHMPVPVFDGPDDDAYNGFLAMSERLPLARGFVVNTFGALEKRAVDAISRGPHPKLYCVGPIVATSEDGRSSECLRWLDGQPKGSVVFLCFGSMGSFPAEQLKEIAAGLERSGQRFLWVVRRAPRSEFVAPEEADAEELLPEGFPERTRGRGLVVMDWAPQRAVLGHAAVGGFVSHCGWNSTLEAVSAGVGMVAWPLHAEQRMNKAVLVEEARVAVEMEGSCCDDGAVVVKAAEVERKVRWLMESEEGRAMKERMRAMRERGAEAAEAGGTSYRALAELATRLETTTEREAGVSL